MLKIVNLVLSVSFLAGQPLADVRPYPLSFESEMVATNGATLNVRVGGNGPAVVLIHGYGETGDM